MLDWCDGKAIKKRLRDWMMHEMNTNDSHQHLTDIRFLPQLQKARPKILRYFEDF